LARQTLLATDKVADTIFAGILSTKPI
jgi:hypothetical protein